MSKHLKVWLLVAANFLSLFGIPLAVGYHYFADEFVERTSQTWGIFTLVVIVAAIALFKRLRIALKKQKASIPKATIKVFFALGGTLLLYFLLQFVGHSFLDLLKVVIGLGIGYTLGYVFEIVALIIDGPYCEEIGVF